MQNVLCCVYIGFWGSHGSPAGAYGWGDGLPHSLLSLSYSQLSLFLLCALSPSSSYCCCSVGKWMGLLFAASDLTLSSSSMHLVRRAGAQVCTRHARESTCVCVCACVWPGHVVLCMQTWSKLISGLQKLAIKSWSGCQFKWNEMEPESN